jgi:hypothetical protein
MTGIEGAAYGEKRESIPSSCQTDTSLVLLT